MKKIGSSAAVTVSLILPPTPPRNTWERLCAFSFWLRVEPKVVWVVMVVSVVGVGEGAQPSVPVKRLTDGGASTLKGAPMGPLNEPSRPVRAGYKRGSVRQSQ